MAAVSGPFHDGKEYITAETRSVCGKLC